MKKIEYQKEVATISGLSMVQVEKAMSAMVSVTKNELDAAKTSKLPGFGMFRVVDLQERKCHNPKTGDTIISPAKQAIRFRLSKGF